MARAVAGSTPESSTCEPTQAITGYLPQPLSHTACLFVIVRDRKGHRSKGPDVDGSPVGMAARTTQRRAGRTERW
jgi:hypothetical protein